MGREALCVFANGAPGTPDERDGEMLERSNKRPRVEVSRLATWGEPVGAPLVPRPSSNAMGTPMAIQNVVERHLGLPLSARAEDSESSLGRMDIKGARSRYIGLGDRLALLDHVSGPSPLLVNIADFYQFSDEKNFIIGTFKDPNLSGLVQEMSGYQKTFNPKRKQPGQTAEDRQSMILEMLHLLPEDSVIDVLVHRYVSDLENVLRVLHIPTFIKQCDEVKNLRRSGTSTLPPHLPEAIVAQLLAVVVITSRLNDSNDVVSAPIRISEDQITTSIYLLQKWLDTTKGKQRINLPVLRAQTLLLIARSANSTSMPELWNYSGILVRVAMIMGLHRDPEQLVEMSKFEKEQRRKIWRTIVELDLQFSLATGMSPAVLSSDFNSMNLVHVDDYDLTEDMVEYPQPKSENIWTDALPQIVLGLSIKERLDAAHILAREIDLERDAHKIVVRAKNLEKLLHSLQKALPTPPKGRSRVFPNIMLDIYLRRPSHALYRTVALSSIASRFPEARKGALRSSVAILSHIDALDPTVADLDTIKSRNYLNLFHILCRNEVVQSALFLCYEIRSYSLPRDPAMAERGFGEYRTR
ncbi:hypothetical protein G7Y89_g11640 [Cudoniella acicularis]|uniref:Xylanolytic transcriptional activator regulatory domain-containing protein n=1 Tax=Cudoniella acicularis TaxID=354080 RepID=A0A8H4RBL5_9HELO|nr:hypothetical protein G7Y89_g11640 [Cudoniella acicularis]